jgi:diaminohydroxyphosphoribosylaminopyrimidine deaminase/5-amino-6-(5-phosphoribosylamino)uracil reductase
VHRLRSDVDAVLVGSTTVRADDPLLDVRHVAAVRSPRPVVLATTADIDPGARVLGRGALVLVGPDASIERCARLERAGATVVAVPEQRFGRAGLDLGAALAALLDHRILTVLAEPGPVLAEALLDEGLVDEVELHVAGATAAGDVVPAVARLAPVIDAWRRRDERVDVVGSAGDTVLRVAWSDLVRSPASAAEVM